MTINSSLSICWSSSGLKYFSLATLFSSRSIILVVVEIPKSEVISISSRSSKKSSSTVDFPRTAFESLLKKELFVAFTASCRAEFLLVFDENKPI
ncbi:MAG: Uncharacterised protein [Bacteroidetes bacterium MED-G17]|nr:MAG: Uncharacterised protein [Bacteroidetes bacterium MED-G17]